MLHLPLCVFSHGVPLLLLCSVCVHVVCRRSSRILCSFLLLVIWRFNFLFHGFRFGVFLVFSWCFPILALCLLGHSLACCLWYLHSLVACPLLLLTVLDFVLVLVYLFQSHTLSYISYTYCYFIYIGLVMVLFLVFPCLFSCFVPPRSISLSLL